MSGLDVAVFPSTGVEGGEVEGFSLAALERGLAWMEHAAVGATWRPSKRRSPKVIE